MRRPKHQVTTDEELFVGIDLHKHRWHVTIRTLDVELFSASIPRNLGKPCSVFWLDILAIKCKRSMKPDILGSGFMTAWWLMAFPA